MTYDSVTRTIIGLEPLRQFIARQLTQIRQGRLSVLRRKGITLLLLLPAALVVIVARLLQPVVLIRFGSLPSPRIGPYAGETELYLCEQDADPPPRPAVDIFFHNAAVCNHQLKAMWDRTLHISHLAKYPYILVERLPGFKTHLVPNGNDRDIRGLLATTQPHLSFTPEEERWGQSWLREQGVPEAAPFVCFFARDSAYLDAAIPGVDWRAGYHDYRDSSIHDHVPAAEELTRRGYFAIRMGAVVKDALTTTNPMIIDYATKSRTDFLDIYLGAKCRFFIGDPSGIIAIPTVFRRPLVWVNTCRLEDMSVWGPDYLLIPKKIWLRQEHRFMTFREIFASGVRRISNIQEYERLGIELVDNTPEEITAVAIEMDERIKGTWRITEEDEELQERFWSLFQTLCKSPEVKHGVLLSHIGGEFLRDNRELLD